MSCKDLPRHRILQCRHLGLPSFLHCEGHFPVIYTFSTRGNHSQRYQSWESWHDALKTAWLLPDTWPKPCHRNTLGGPSSWLFYRMKGPQGSKKQGKDMEKGNMLLAEDTSMKWQWNSTSTPGYVPGSEGKTDKAETKFEWSVWLQWWFCLSNWLVTDYLSLAPHLHFSPIITPKGTRQ